MRISKRAAAAVPAIALLALSAACSKSAGSTAAPPASTPASSSSSAAASSPAGSGHATLNGSLSFNQASLAARRRAEGALAGKSLSAVNIAMVVNVAADYWKAGQVGFLKGCKDLGSSSTKCTYFAPPNGKLTEQNSELETLRSQGITGYSISAIDPAVGGGHHRHRHEQGRLRPADRLAAAGHRRGGPVPGHAEQHRRLPGRDWR